MRNLFFIVFIQILIFNVSSAYGQRAYIKMNQDQFVDSNYMVFENRINETNIDSTIVLVNDWYNHLSKQDESKAFYYFIYNHTVILGAGFTEYTIANLNHFAFNYKQNNDTLNFEYLILNEALAYSYKYTEQLQLSYEFYNLIYRLIDSISESVPAIISAEIDQSYGSLVLHMGDAENAYKYLTKALHIKDSLGDLYGVTHCYLELARAMDFTNQNKLANSFNLKATELLTKHYFGTPNHIVASSNQASNCITNKDYIGALNWANYADSVMHLMQLESKIYTVYFSILANRGIALKNLEKYELAQRDLNELVQQIRKYFGNSPILGDGYFEIAALFYDQNQYDSALVYCNKVLYCNKYNTQANSLLADIYEIKSNYKKAEYYNLTTLTIVNKLDSNYFKNKELPLIKDLKLNNETLNIMVDLTNLYGKLYLESKDKEYKRTFLEYLKITDTLYSHYGNSVLIGSSHNVFAKQYRGFADKMIQYLFELNSYSEENYDPLIINFVSRAKTYHLNAIDDLLKRDLPNSSVYIEQNKLYQEITSLENRIDILKQTNTYNDSVDVYAEYLFGKRIEVFNNSFKLQYHANEEVDNAILYESIDFENLQSTLQNKTILSYFLCDTMLYCTIIDDKNRSIEALGSLQSLENNILKHIRNIKTVRFNKDINKLLYEQLILPIEADISNTNDLIINADLFLYKLPFETLINPKTNRYLIEDKAISYTYSLGMWHKEDDTPPSFLGVAPGFTSKQYVAQNNPVRNSKENEIFQVIANKEKVLVALPETLNEVNSISNLFSENNYTTQVIINESADEKQIKQHLSDYSIVHIATHGYSSTTNPELSGLFLSSNENSTNDIMNDGYLFIGEISNLELNADLVVLSACNTGMGKIIEGNGILNLPRSFILNNVDNVLCAQWKIDDKKTSAFMQQFYTNYLQNDNYSKALQKTKVDFIKNEEHVVDWASFMLISNE